MERSFSTALAEGGSSGGGSGTSMHEERRVKTNRLWTVAIDGHTQLRLARQIGETEGGG